MKEDILQKHPDLKGFSQHGVVFTDVSGTQAIGTCPWCRKPKKFYVNHKTLVWDCKRCGHSGNFNKFLETSGKEYQEGFKGRQADDLSSDRGLMRKTLKRWGVGWSGEFYTIPINGTGKTTDLRRYRIGGKILSTSGSKVGLAGIDVKSENVWIFEGEWDAMAFSEVLGKLRMSESVYAVCGAGSFPKDAANIFQGKNVRIVFDNDEAGRRGETKVGNLLEGYASSVKFLHWPEEAPDGYDVRDLYIQEGKRALKVMKEIKEHLKDGPRQVSGQQETKQTVEQLTGKGLSVGTVVREYRRWLHLREPDVLSVVYGAVFANRLDGDPIWLFLVAPPGGTKSEILMSMSESPLMLTTTTLTVPALISGANTFGGDPSLIPKLDGKILIVKDFTAILSMQSVIRDEIFGILRDAYDGRVDKYFGNGVLRQYKSKFGVIGGVTSVIEAYSSSNSVLGERFLKYTIREPGTINKGKKMIQQALKNVTMESEMREDLKCTANKALNMAVDPSRLPVVSKKYDERFLGLAQWVASMRGVVVRDKYTREVQYKPTSEIGTRLAKQLKKLAMGIAIFHREDKITEDVYRIVAHVARDTGPDRVEEVVKQLYLRSDEEYVPLETIGEWTKFPTSTLTNMLEDLRMLGVVQKDKGRSRLWMLSKAMVRKMKPLGIYAKEEEWLQKGKGRKRK